jgi:hypothetical protein
VGTGIQNKMKVLLLIFAQQVLANEGLGQTYNGLSMIAWIFIGVALIFVPLALICFGCYLERAYGRPERALKNLEKHNL